jgi:hypothetical protein
MKKASRIWEDPIVEEVRAAGARIAKECDYDLSKMISRFRRVDAQEG